MSTTLESLSWPRRTARLEIRPARSEDAAAIWPWYGRPEVHEWTSAVSRTLEQHQERWDSRRASTLVASEDGVIIAVGTVRRQDAWAQADVAADAQGRQAELGWVLDPAAQGRGLGTEFAADLLDIAISGLGVRRVEAACFAQNHASRRVMEKIGLRLEGVFREESLHRSGQWLDGMSWALLASEYDAAAAPDPATPEPAPRPAPARGGDPAADHPAAAASPPPAPDSQATFTVEMSPAPEELPGTGRFTVHKTWRGALEGTSTGILLTGGDPATGDAGYVAVERFEGHVQGRPGGLSLHQLGTMSGGEPSLEYVIVPGSGDGELASLRGSLEIASITEDGVHTVRLTVNP